MKLSALMLSLVDINSLTKGAVATYVHEWFAPVLGVVRSEIGPAGHPLITMELTAVTGSSTGCALAH